MKNKFLSTRAEFTFDLQRFGHDDLGGGGTLNPSGASLLLAVDNTGAYLIKNATDM